jgi:hypothetical protein
MRFMGFLWKKLAGAFQTSRPRVNPKASWTPCFVAAPLARAAASAAGPFCQCSAETAQICQALAKPPAARFWILPSIGKNHANLPRIGKGSHDP